MLPACVASNAVTSTAQAPSQAPSIPPQAGIFTHVPSLDGLRAIAVLLVVFSHGSYWLLPPDVRIPMGGIGVGIFFVLSYLITSLLLRERSNRGRISLRDFYVRRALRIWPLYYAVLLFHLLVLLHIDAKHWGGVWLSPSAPQYPNFGHVWWSYLVFAQNYVSDLKHVNLGLGVYWSLAIEEQYYLVWPLVLIGLSRVRWRWTIPTFLVGATALSYLLRALTIQGHLPAAGGGVEWMTHTNLFGLALGSLLGWSRWDRLRNGGSPRAGGGFGAAVAWIVVGAILLHRAAPIIDNGWALRLPHAGYYEPLLLSIAVTAIIDYVADGASKWSPLQWKPMVYVGRVSYGTYLLHPLVLGVAVHILRGKGWIQMFLFVLVSLAVAAASYELFEKRILRFKRRFSHVPSRGTEPPT